MQAQHLSQPVTQTTVSFHNKCKEHYVTTSNMNRKRIIKMYVLPKMNIVLPLANGVTKQRISL